MHTFPRLPLAALLVGLLAGCPSVDPTPPEELLPPAPSVVSFRVRQVQMESKVQLLLEWETTGASKVSITDSHRGAISGVDDQASGAVEIAAPERDTLYVLVAKNTRGVSTSAMTTLGASGTVGELLFVATPAEVVAGESVTLAWSVPGGTEFALSGNDLPIPLSERTSQGTLQVFPQRDTIYKLSAGGKALSTSVRVESSLKSFAISSLSGLPREQLTLTWEASGAVRIVLSEGHAGVLVDASLAQQAEQLSSGRYLFTVPATSSLEDIFDFTLVMTDGSGTQHVKRLTAYVSGRPRLVSLEAPKLARRDSTFSLKWSAVSVDRVELTFANEVVYRSPDRLAAAKGEIQVPTPLAAGTFRLTAYGERGGGDFRDFEIDPVGAPQIASIGVTPSTVNGGTRTEATWVVSNSRYAVLRDAKGRVVAERRGLEADGTVSVELYPNATGTYTLEIDNGLGESASLESGVVTVPVPVVLLPDLQGAIIEGTPVQLTHTHEDPGSLLYGVVHSEYTEQAPSTGFIDISTTGKKLNTSSSDGGWFEFMMPADFTPLVFGEHYSGKVAVCANGYLAFRQTNGSCLHYSTALPSASLGEKVLAAFWGDLMVMADFGGVFWQLVGEGEARVLVVQWDRVTYWSNQPGTEFTFQIQVRLDGAVHFEYAGLNLGTPTPFVPLVAIQKDMTTFASYPVTPAANSRIAFLGPKAPPITVNAGVQPVRALMKVGTSFMEVAWEPEQILRQKDLSFSEVMALPAGEVEETGEYFELYNQTDRAVSLDGFSVEDAHGNVLTTFAAGNGQTSIPPRGFLVVGQSLSSSENDGANVEYAYGAPILPDLAGTLKLVKRVPIDSLDYKQSTAGVALVFDPNPYILSTDSQPSSGPALPHPISCDVTENEVFGFQTPPQRGSPGAASSCSPYSLSPIDVDFFDISTTGQRVINYVDESWVNVDLSALPIPGFGRVQDKIRVSSNGLTTFNPTYSGGWLTYSPSLRKPSSETAAESFALLAADMKSSVYVQLLAEDPARTTPDAHWIIQWRAHHFGEDGDWLDFQLKLFKDGTAEYHYGTLIGFGADGEEAVRWLVDSSGTRAIVLGAQALTLQENTAFRFRYSP